MGLGIVHVGEHVMFGIVEQSGDLAKAWAELIGDAAPGLSGGLAIGLDEDLPDSGRHCWLFGTWASSDLMKCTRHRCQVALRTCVMAALRPSWASEMTSLTPLRPRRTRPRKNSIQKVAASD